ncbi:hypothetical protein JI57_01035 [Psychromonas sp. PRT-SC03]|nr:hypothetical protein JI57_01035 [Psychromonas sp. PRT-SC03]
MFYEGREKRLEIVTQGVNLLNFPLHFWHAMVKNTGAYILCELKETKIKAFILSESSLFIWENKLLLITCGNTHLLQAALYFKNESPVNSIKSLLFQRHQANQPDAQKSTFSEDIAILQTMIKGKCQHWQDDYQGDIFQSDTYQSENSTTDIIMLNSLQSCFSKRLHNTTVSSATIEQQLQLNTYFKTFSIHQHSFHPRGYSVNGVQDEYYFTLHLSPEKVASYLSFETNLESDISKPFIEHLITLFNPKKSYLMSFTSHTDISIKVLK